MKTKQRFAFLLLAPAVIGSVLFVVRAIVISPSTAISTLTLIPTILIAAVIFSILPSALYTVIIGWWEEVMRRNPSLSANKAWSRVLTIALSTVLGAIAGQLIHLASEAPVTIIGAVTGLLLGVFMPSLKDSGEQSTR